jgi:hypothetical protein
MIVPVRHAQGPLTEDAFPDELWTLLVGLLVLLAVAAPFAFGLPWIGYLSGTDSNFALQLVSGYSQELRSGHLFPQWLASGNSGFGSPVLYFYGRVPFLVAATVQLVFRLSASSSLVVGMILFRGLAFVTCRTWLKRLVSSRAADLGALVFISLPFAMTANPITRVGYAEVAATAFLPLLLWGIETSACGWRSGCGTIAFLGVVNGLLAITHLPQLLLSFFLLTVYTVVRGRTRAVFIHLAGTALGILSAAAFIFPALLTRNLINAAGWTDNPYLDIRRNFLFTTTRYHLYKMYDLDICLYATWFLCLGLLLWGYRYSRRSHTPMLTATRAAAVTLAIGLIAMTPVTKSIWIDIRSLHTIQFPWRVFPSTLAFAAMVAGIIAQTKKSSRQVLLSGVTMLIIGQLGVIYAGAFLSLTSFTQHHRVPNPIVRRLPSFVGHTVRDVPENGEKWAVVPEYLPQGAVKAGWNVDSYRYRVLLNGKPYPTLPQQVPGLVIRKDQRGDLMLQGTLQTSTVVNLPTFFYPDERLLGTPSSLVEADPKTGLARARVSSGPVRLTLQHSAPVKGETMGKLLSTLGCLLLCLLLALGLKPPFPRDRGSSRQACRSPMPDTETAVKTVT